MPAARFPLGRVVATPGVLTALARNEVEPITFLVRHQTGDWGELSPADRAENELSVVHGFRIHSAYTLSDQTWIWVITQADRSSTCLLLPEEY